MGGSNLMSAIAGRVLLIPKGNYDSTATYTMLDMVVYNGSSYICKQECTGVVPTNTTYWMLNASGSAVAYINDIGDVVITNVSNGQVLMYDSATQKWVNGTLSTTLAGLTDTQIASLQNGQVLKYNSTSQKWENAEDTGGLLPHLIIIAETGESVVKAVKGQTEIIATETSTGHYECDVPEFGTWTIHAVLNGDDAQVSLVVDTVKVYTVDDSHFHATVTVKYPEGATCRLQSADETLYATGSPYTFTVHHKETYTITVTYNQRIYTDTVTFTTEGQSFSKTLPSPSEVDANDIDWWLWFGGVSGSYSSLSDILADSTALATLMASTDAVDYLVRCTNWISDICGNQSAMSYIGLNNYCANTLLADSDWLDGIANSEYIDSVLNVKVPVMTSNTTPSGECFASSVYNTNYPPYKAFTNQVDTYGWNCAQSEYGTIDTAYVGYEFSNKKKIYVAKFTISTDGTLSSTEIRVVANDASNESWNVVSEVYSETNLSDIIICNSNLSEYKRFALKGSFVKDNTRYLQFKYIQFYGREDV